MESRELEALDLWDKNNSEAKIATVFQLGREFDSVEALNDILIDHYLQNFNATHIEILRTLTWKYFPRYIFFSNFCLYFMYFFLGGAPLS